LKLGDQPGDPGGTRQRPALGDGFPVGGPQPGDPGLTAHDETGAGEPPRGETERPASSGRNLPVAAGVGVFLGGIVLLTLFTVKATFLVFAGLAAAVALWEMGRALGSKGIRVPVIPIGLGGAAMWLSEYWWTQRAVLAAFIVTVIVLIAWRLPGGPDGYLRDVAASVFTLVYIPLMALFIVAMLAPGDGARRVVTLVIFTVCSDVGGYFAGTFLGRHPMAPAISPHKTWEGTGGSVLACLIAGAILFPVLLHGHLWQGVLAGAAAVTAAILGDLAESAIKRDLKIKDMGSLLPGHGGVLDRVDALLVCAPVTWLLLAVFLPGH
jgi:phosphatidate cytidylyltransferase